MKRVLIVAILATMIVGAAVARPMGHEGSYVAKEVAKITEEEKARELAAVTIGEMKSWSDRLSAAAAKDAYVARTGAASFMVPGMGQLKNKQTGLGALLLGSHLAVGVGSLLGTYFLLPADLRFDALDYLRTPAAGIETAWKSHSLLDYLPSMALCFGGHLLDMGLRALAAHNASAVARQRIEGGAVTPSADRL